MTSTQMKLKVLFFIVLENFFDDQTPQWTFLCKQLTYFNISFILFHCFAFADSFAVFN